jgi:hypothetical protein
MFKKMMVSLSVLGLGVLGFGAASASAQVGVPPVSDAAAVVFSGVATLGTNILPAPATGGSGGYGFTGSCLVSAGVSLGNPLNDSQETLTCSRIDSTGTYNNIVCGTGTATGSATVTATGSDGSDESVVVNYTIVFAAGVGALVITGGHEVADPADTVAPGAGAVLLTNLAGESCAGPGNVTGFNITGAAEITILETSSN